MSEEIIRQLSARLDEMSKRIDQQQSAIAALEPRKKWYKPTTPGELIAFVGIPLAIITALYGLYDGVWLKVQRLDAATLSVAQDKLTELQDLRSEIFVLQARENDAEIAAILEAKASRRDRLVEESFIYWTQQPSYFSNKETLLLTQELQLQQRQGDALKVVETVAAVGVIENADLDRLKGSLYGAEGPSQNLGAAREHFQSALLLASELPSEAARQQLAAKFAFSWLYTELSNRTGCEHTRPIAARLAELLANDPDAYNLGILDAQARVMLDSEAELCD